MSKAAPLAGAPAPQPVSLEMLQAIVDGVPEGACLIVGGRIVAANQRFAEQTGRSLAEMVGSPDMFGLVAPDDRERLRKRYEARQRGEDVSDTYEFTGLRPDGARVSARARVSPFPLAGPGAILFLSVGERGQKRSVELIRGLVDAAIAAQNERTLTGIFRVAHDRLTALGLSVAFTEHAGNRFRFLSADGVLARAADALRERFPVWIPLESFALLHSASRSAQGVLVEDVSALLGQLLGKPRSQVGMADQLQAMAAGIPVDGGVAFSLAACGPALDSAIAGAFGLFGKQLGAAIETTRRLDDLARSNRELTTVNHIARASATLASGLALKEAVERLALSVSIDSIALFRREDDQLVLAVQQGFPDAWVAEATRVPVGRGTPWGEAAAGGEPVVFDIDDGPDWESARCVPTPPGGVPSLLSAASSVPERISDSIAVPLHVSDDVNGVLVAARPGAPLTRDDLRLLTTVAAQLAVSLQNVLLFQTTQRRISELSLLLELGQAVSGSLDIQEVLAAGARVAARVLRCSAAWVLLPDASRTHLQAAAAEDPLLDDRRTLSLPLERSSLCALAFKSGKAQMSSDASADPRVDPEFVAILGCRATVAVPLVSHDRTLGVLLLIERRPERLFGPHDVRMASHAAQLLAAALENADLFARERQRAQEMSLLNEVSRSLAGSLELRPLLRAAAGTLSKLVGAPNCFILLWDEQSRSLRCQAATPPFADRCAEIVLRADEPALALDALRQKRALQVRDASTAEGANPRMLEMFGRQTVFAVPMLARDEAVGAIVIGDHRSRVFTDAEVERTTAVAGQVALAVLSARLYEDLRASYAELARTQSELVDRERLAVLGEMSASIAHEVRNPLGVIFNSLHSLKRLLRPEGDVKFLLEVVAEEADRLNRMVGDLLDYSRPLQPALQPVHLRTLVRDAIAAARPRSEPSAAAGAAEAFVEVGVHVADQLWVRADPRLLRQALINLVLNAFQAMPKGGALRVLASLSGSDSGDVTQQNVRVVIEDTGPGIAPESRARVFQPFFTTKATGTGLGLAVVKRILERHGGSVAVGDSERGAAFHLVLAADAAP